MPKDKIRKFMSEFERNSQWTLFTGRGIDYEKTFDWADMQFNQERNPGVADDLFNLNFDTTKLFVIVSDGRLEARRDSHAMRQDLLIAKADLAGAKVSFEDPYSFHNHYDKALIIFKN